MTWRGIFHPWKLSSSLFVLPRDSVLVNDSDINNQFRNSTQEHPLRIYISRNIFSLTPLFIVAGFPSSNSSPASPPSRSIPSSLSRNSSSSSAIVFFFSGLFAVGAEWLSGSCSTVCEIKSDQGSPVGVTEFFYLAGAAVCGWGLCSM